MPSFLGGKSRGAFGQPAFFLAGNRMTIVAFETIVRRYCSFKLEKETFNTYNGKKKFKRILVVGENFKLRKLPSKDLIALFSSRRRACLVLKHNRVSEVFKGFKAGLNLKFDQNVDIFVFSKSYASGPKECYGHCFRVNFVLFRCWRSILFNAVEKHFRLPWQRNVAFFVFTSISVPAVHPIPENPFPLL